MNRKYIISMSILFIPFLFTECGPAEDPGPFSIGIIPPEIAKTAPITQTLVKIKSNDKKNSKYEAELNYQYRVLSDTGKKQNLSIPDLK
jgi:hypothetical protein